MRGLRAPGVGIVLTLGVLVVPARARAQFAAADTIRSIVEKNRTVRLSVGPDLFVLRDAFTDRSGVLLADPGLPRSRLNWADIEQVDVGRSSSGKGAKIGAIVGGSLALLTVFSFGDVSSAEGVAALMGYTAISTAAYAGIGALVGLAVRRWETVYRRGGG